MNDRIDPRVCSVSYTTVNDAARAIEAASVSVYCMISIHLEDRPIVDIVWQGA